MEPLSPKMTVTQSLRLRPVPRQKPRPQQRLKQKQQLSKQDIEKKTFHKKPRTYEKCAGFFYLSFIRSIGAFKRPKGLIWYS